MSLTGPACLKAMFRLMVALSVLFQLNAAAAQQFENVPVLIEIQKDSVDPTLQPLVMVNGELAGMTGGYVALSASEEAIVEVGLPSARLPLYSFVFGPAVIEEKIISFIMTTYTFEQPDADLWQSVTIKPNRNATTELNITDDGSFVIVLPAEPYESFQRILEAGEVQQFGANWLEDVPDVNNRSRELGVSHRFSSTGEDQWSGADLDLMRLSWGGGMGRRHKLWHIVSRPKGASIYSQLGEHGLTDHHITLPDVGETYVVLRLADHYDCSSSACGCVRRETPSEVQLSCTLKPYP